MEASIIRERTDCFAKFGMACEPPGRSWGTKAIPKPPSIWGTLLVYISAK